MSDDPLSDMTGGLISGRGAVIHGTITIGGVTHVRTEDGSYRPATEAELKALEERRAAKAAAKAQAKAEQAQHPRGPDIIIGDVAGGNITRIRIDVRRDTADD